MSVYLKSGYINGDLAMKNVYNTSNTTSKSGVRGLPNAPMAMPAQSLERRVARRTSTQLPFIARLASK